MFSYPKLVGQTVTRVIQSGLEGSPVVFVHGTGARADRWIRNLEPVAEAGFRAYAIDLPGHGLAAKDPAFNHSVPAYAEFLGQFLNNFGGEKVTLIGTSLGGHVAATCTINRPERWGWFRSVRRHVCASRAAPRTRPVRPSSRSCTASSPIPH